MARPPARQPASSRTKRDKAAMTSARTKSLDADDDYESPDTASSESDFQPTEKETPKMQGSLPKLSRRILREAPAPFSQLLGGSHDQSEEITKADETTPQDEQQKQDNSPTLKRKRRRVRNAVPPTGSSILSQPVSKPTNTTASL